MRPTDVSPIRRLTDDNVTAMTVVSPATSLWPRRAANGRGLGSSSRTGLPCVATACVMDLRSA